MTKDYLKLYHAFEYDDLYKNNKKDLVIEIEPEFLRKNLKTYRNSIIKNKSNPSYYLTRKKETKVILNYFNLKTLKSIFDLSNNYSIDLYYSNGILGIEKCFLYLKRILKQ